MKEVADRIRAALVASIGQVTDIADLADAISAAANNAAQALAGDPVAVMLQAFGALSDVRSVHLLRWSADRSQISLSINCDDDESCVSAAALAGLPPPVRHEDGGRHWMSSSTTGDALVIYVCSADTPKAA